MDQVQHRRGLLSRGFDVIRQMFSITTDFSLLILSIILELNKEVVTKKKRRKSEPVECRQQIDRVRGEIRERKGLDVGLLG